MSEFDLLVASVVVTGTGDVRVDAEYLSVDSALDRMRKLRGRNTEYFRQTDGGNADRFAARFGETVLADVDGRGQRRYYVADETNLWDKDTSGRVARMAEVIIEDMYSRADQLDPPDVPRPTEDGADDPFGDTRDAGTSLRSHARRTDTLVGRRNMAAIATDKFGLRIPGVQHFDTDPSLIACGDGEVLVLADRSVTPRARELADMCHRCVRAPYRPEILDSPPELIKQFIEKFLPEENRVKLLFKLLGHALPGGNPNRYFVILKGGTTSGKTQLISTLQWVLDGYATTSSATIFRANKDERPRADIINVLRNRIVFLPEASKKSWELHASRIKQFTGGDQESQRALHSNDFVNERPQCMPVVYTNEMPRIIGMDPATKRRVIVPTMNHTIAKEDEDITIKERFLADPEVHAWLFAALIRGYLDARLEGMADVEAEFSMATSEGTGAMYHLAEFLNWVRDSGRLTQASAEERQAYGVKSSYVTQEMLFSTYANWCKVFGNRYDRIEALGYTDFNAELQDNHGFNKVKSGCWRWEGYRLQEVSLADLRESARAGLN